MRFASAQLISSIRFRQGTLGLLLMLVLAKAANAQIEPQNATQNSTQIAPEVAPEEAFNIDWITFSIAEQAGLRAVITSSRASVSTLDYTFEVLRTDANDNSSVSRQSGLVTPKAGEPDTTSTVLVNITPGTRIQANVTFTNVQEGWSISDTIVRRVGPPAKPQQNVAIDPDFLEVDGLVADRTLTKSGQDFFQIFYQAWQPPLGARSYSVLVEEVPWRGRQTLIQVSINDEEPLYQQIVQPRYDVVEEMALQAVGFTTFALQTYLTAQSNNDGEVGEPIETY